MAKTYEIWRKINPAADRYDFANYTKVFDVSPIGEVRLDTARYEEEVFYRTELSSSLSLGGADFYKVFCAKQDPVVNELVYLFVILDDGVTYWKGFLSLFNGQWDEDECTCELPVRVFDDYSGLLDNKDLVKNLILEVTSKKTFHAEQDVFVEFRYVYDNSGIPTGEEYNGWINMTSYNGEVADIYIYSRKRASCLINDTFAAYAPQGVDTCTVYAKEFEYIPTTGFLNDNCATDYSSTHYKIYDGSDGGNCIWVEFSKTVDSAAPTEDSQTYSNAMHFEDIVNEFAGDFGYTFVSEFYLGATNPITSEANKLNDLLFLQGSDAGTPTATEKARVLNMTFSALMTFFRDHNARWYIDSNGDFRAEHIDYFDGALSYTVAQTYDIDATQKVDARTDYVSIAKTNKYGYDFSKIFKFEQFSWALAETENFIGVKIYYDDELVNSKSENNTKDHNSGFFTDFPYVLAKPSEINNDSILVVATELVSGSNYKILNEVGILDGEQECAPFYENASQTSGLLTVGWTYTLSNWITDDDFTNVGAPSNADGVVFVATGTTPTKWTNSSVIRRESVKYYPNNHLSWANLHDNYFKYDRVLLDGFMNNAATVFETNKPIIVQEEIQFPLCPDDFDPLRYIKTNLGDDGIVVRATESMRTGMLNVTLEYRALDNMRECVCLVPIPIQVGTFIVGADCQVIS